MVRSGLRNLIQQDESLRVVAEAVDGEELPSILRENPCDMLILDLSMPRMNGLQILSNLKEEFPELRVLILTMHKEKEFFRRAVSRGVHGYILKDDMLESVHQAIGEIRAGRKSYSAELTSHIADDYMRVRDGLATSLLTPRETQVLKLIASGKTNREIASDLDIGVRTVETHRKNIMDKLDIRNASGLTRYAVDHGIV